MAVNKKRVWLLGTVFGIVACFITWIFQSDASPFHDYFLFNVGLPNMWINVNIVPILAAFAIGIPGMAYISIFIQWFLIGGVFRWIFLGEK